MTPLRALHEQASLQGVEFIVCGGFAVNAYHVIRKTGDLDLVVRGRDAVIWRDILTAQGYALYHESAAFLQFQAPAASAWPIDLLLVDDSTFDRMKREGQPFRFDDTLCLIPSVNHLIAMKLHALKHTGERRMRQDAIDIVELAERTGIDLRGDGFRQQCETFADLRTYERILLYAGETPER